MKLGDLFTLRDIAKLLQKPFFIGKDTWVGKVEQSPELLSGVRNRSARQQHAIVPRHSRKLLKQARFGVLEPVSEQELATHGSITYLIHGNIPVRLVDKQSSPSNLGKHGNVLQNNFVRRDQNVKLCDMVSSQLGGSRLWYKLLGVVELLLNKKVARVS